jgi:hypothetical protein
MRNSKSEALASLGKLEKLGQQHINTGKTILKLAVALRKVTDEVSVHAEATEPKKVPQKRGKGHSKTTVIVKKRKMSNAARKLLSTKMKQKWAERKAAA